MSASAFVLDGPQRMGSLIAQAGVKLVDQR